MGKKCPEHSRKENGPKGKMGGRKEKTTFKVASCTKDGENVKMATLEENVERST